MPKYNTLPSLIDRMNQKFGYVKFKLWEKGGNSRIYTNLGNNTKKMTTKAFIHIMNNTFVGHVYIDCPSQSDTWIKSQEKEVLKQLSRFCDLMTRIFDFGIPMATEPAEVIMTNALLEAETVQGYTLEWKQKQVKINRFGKLATRNRQYVLPFKGAKSEAPSKLVLLSPEAFALLIQEADADGIMLEPYAAPRDYELIVQGIRQSKEQ